MRTKEQIAKELDATLDKMHDLEEKAGTLHEEYRLAELQEKSQQERNKYKHIIVCGELRSVEGKYFDVEYRNGLPIIIDDYGMGSSLWSLVQEKEDAQDRQLMDNVIWAVERMAWAQKNAPDELQELQEIILTGGKSRFPDDWQSLPGKKK